MTDARPAATRFFTWWSANVPLRGSRLSAKGATSGPFQIWIFNRRNGGIQHSNEYCKVFCVMAIRSIISKFKTNLKLGLSSIGKMYFILSHLQTLRPRELRKAPH